MGSQQGEISVRFCQPPESLRRYFTTFYRVDFAIPNGESRHDHLHPEWGNLRFISGDPPMAYSDATVLADKRFIVTGPSSRAVRISVQRSRMWGIGLLPLGWAKFVALPACDFADALLDGERHAAFARFVPLAERLFGKEPDDETELHRIAAHFLACSGGTLNDEDRILAIHGALVDPDIATVGELVEASGLGQRMVERLCDRAFGFAPRMLLRRQRFMRSLTQFMLDPSPKWISAIDGHYHDQSQFVRDFHKFMGMSPREYAAQEHPILGAIMRERMRIAGEAVQTLHHPLLGPIGPAQVGKG